MPRRRSMVLAARDLRQRMTPAEARLWEHLRERRLAGIKFRRQCPVGPFVADFCQRDTRLVIELDGGVHRDQTAADANRQNLLESWGHTVLRFPNARVLHNLPVVLEEIRIATESLRES